MTSLPTTIQQAIRQSKISTNVLIFPTTDIRLDFFSIFHRIFVILPNINKSRIVLFEYCKWLRSSEKYYGNL